MMISRRQWMAGGAALATTLAAGPLVAKGLKRRPIGLQLYTVRELFSKDPMGTLEKIAKIGYREVEYGGGGYDKMDHAALRKTMDRLGLKSPSLHISYEALGSDLGGAVRMAKTLGADTVVVPYMVDAHRNAEGWKKAVADFNRYAE